MAIKRKVAKKSAKAKVKSKSKAKPKPKKAAAKKAAAKKAAKPAKKKAAAKKPPAKAAKALAKATGKPAKKKPPAKAVAAKPVARTRVKQVKDELQEIYDNLTATTGPAAAASKATVVRSTTTLVQTVELPAAPAYVYRALLDSEQHSKFTNGGAKIDPSVGGRFTAWDGYISGANLELIEGQRIVQSWRTSEWPDDYDDSRLEITLAPSTTGTKLTMVHDGVPSSQAASLEQGWIDHYWEPLRKFFAAVSD